MQLEHDAAHRIIFGVLRLVVDRFDDEEVALLYREAMPIAVAAIRDYSERRDRRDARLCVRAVGLTTPTPATPLPPDGPDAD